MCVAVVVITAEKINEITHCSNSVCGMLSTHLCIVAMLIKEGEYAKREERNEHVVFCRRQACW